MTTSAQQRQLDQAIYGGWKRVHTKADGTIVVRQSKRHSGSSGIGVNLPGPFHTHVGRSSGYTTYKYRNIHPDGTVVDPDHVPVRTKLITFAVIVGIVLIFVFPATLLLLAIGLAWYAIRLMRREAKTKIESCAVCRGERDGSVILQPPDAELCQSHWQQRHRIEHMESTYLR